MNVFHLAPHGSDRNDGSSQLPWASLAGARDALRALRASGTISGAVRVQVDGGAYPLHAPVEFGPQDSHTTYAAAPGATAIFDGGEALHDWREETVHGRRAWVLDVPEVAHGRRYFRSLFVNGVRRPRARLPKFAPDNEGVANVFRIGELRFPEKRALMDGDNVFKPAPGDVQNWPSLWDAEIVLLHYWVETRLGGARFDPETGWLRCARRSVFNLYESFNPKLARYYIDNLFEALTEPGEWYLDRTHGRLYYLPLPGEQPASTVVVVPRTNAFVRAHGTAYNHSIDASDLMGGQAVKHLCFEGLTFRHGDWYAPLAQGIKHDRMHLEDIPLGGAPQAAMHVPGVFEFRFARQCAITRCVIEHIGFSAVEFGIGCRTCSVTHTTMRDVGAGGVKVNGAELDGAPAERTGQITVADNTITRIGRIFQQGVGVLLANAFDCDVLHNEIAFTCYTGISCGWAWGFRETIARNNRIEGNFIHDIGQGVLSDMGAVYLLGVQPGTVVRGNHICRVTSADYGGWGIYPDEGSSHILIESNWVHDTQGSPLRIHFSRELVVRNNVFARAVQEGLVGIGRVEDNIAATVLHNVLLGPAPLLFEGGYKGDVRAAFVSDANLIWFADAPVAPCGHGAFRTDVPQHISFDEWRAAGRDCASRVADPQVSETETSLVFAPASPALALGFTPVDWRRCGPRTA